MSGGLNRASADFILIQKIQNVIKAEKILRRIDDVYLIDSLKYFNLRCKRYIRRICNSICEDYDLVLEGKPVFITNNLENKTSVILNLPL